jgi:hypothetical protein
LKLFLVQIVKAVWRARVTFFWPIWIATTIGAAICVAWMVGRAKKPIFENAIKTPIDLTRIRRHVWSRGAAASLTLLGLFLACYVALILKWEDFAYSDNDMFTLFTLKGHDIDPPIWQGDGRFFPLGHQEFNLVRHLTSTVVGYHVLPIVQLLLVCCILLVLDDELSIAARAALAGIVLITPGIVASFGGLIFTERNVVFWLACMVLFIKRFERTQFTLWAVAAAVCAQIMIYYKETAFLLLVGFSVWRLVVRSRNIDQAGWNFSRLREKESRLDICLACLGLLFLVYYVAVMLPRPRMKYADQFRLPTPDVFLSYIKLDLLVWVFVAIMLIRTYLILQHRVIPSLLWDGLAFGGVICFAAYLRLHMFTAYFLAPVDVIAVLYVGRLAILSWKNMHLWTKAIGLIFLFTVLFQYASLSAFSVFERKNVIHSKAELARVVEGRYQNSQGSVRRLFFPFTNPYRVMEFASYLNYRGVPVEGASVEPAGLNSVVVVSKAVAKDGPCVEYRSLICRAGVRPNPDDLVIALPDDDSSLGEIATYQEGGDLLLSYKPRPQIPEWLYPWVRRLHIASTPFPQKELPDHWLDASLTVWK